MDNKKKCIYCPSPGPFSKEHALPYSLGQFKGFSELKDTICKDCNSKKISISEDQFLHSTPEAFFKEFLGIKGRKKHITVNIFKRGSAGAPPIDFIGHDPESDLDILFEFNPGSKTLKEVDEQIVFVDKNGKCFPYRVPPWIEKSKQLFDHVRKTIPKDKYDALFFRNDRFLKRMKKMLKGIGNNFEISEPLGDTIIKEQEIKCHFTDLYFRAIAKIAFHYFLTVFDIYRGDEDLFSPIREFIIEGGNREDFVKDKTKAPILAKTPNWWTHIIKTVYDQGYIFVYLQFFSSAYYEPIKYMVRLNRNIDSLAVLDNRCHLFSYYQPIQQIDGCYGEVVELKSKALYLFR